MWLQRRSLPVPSASSPRNQKHSNRTGMRGVFARARASLLFRLLSLVKLSDLALWLTGRDLLLSSLLSLPPWPASMRRTVPLQAAVPWIRRRVQGWCSIPPSPRASAGSPSCTAPTPTTTPRPRPCRATPPSTVRGEHRCHQDHPLVKDLETKLFFFFFGPLKGQFTQNQCKKNQNNAKPFLFFF